MKPKPAIIDVVLLRGIIYVPCLSAAVFIAIMAAAYFFAGDNAIPLAILAYIASAVTFIYHQVSVTIWKVWAFEKVRNVNELKERAISSYIIHPDGSLLKSFEIWLPGYRSRWRKLQHKFSKPDEFFDSPEIPAETIIVSKRIPLRNLINIAVFIGAGVLILFYDAIIIGCITIGTGLVMFIIEYKNSDRRKQYLIINDLGIDAEGIGFKSWDEISNETVRSSLNGYRHVSGDSDINPANKEELIPECKHSSGYTTVEYEYVFEYDYTGGHFAVELKRFNINPKTLALLIKTYRLRHRLPG